MPRPSPQTDRVVTLVSLLAASPDEPWTLAALTRRLDVNKSTVHSMLAVLHGAGWLVRDPVRKVYRLGPALAAVGRAASVGFPALAFASSAIDELAARFDAAGVVLFTSDRSLVVGHTVAARPGEPGPQVGAAIPLRAPFGAAVAAWADPATVQDWMSHVPPDAEDDYVNALRTVRQRGWAVELTPGTGIDQLLAELRRQAEGDSQSVTIDMLERVADSVVSDVDQLADDLQPDIEYSVNAINAPVFDGIGQVSLVMSLLGFDSALRGDAIVGIGGALTEATRELSAALGVHA